jgi:hypothetical protein
MIRLLLQEPGNDTFQGAHMAKIFITRPRQYWGGGMAHHITVDGEPLTDLWGGQDCMASVESGSHTVEVQSLARATFILLPVSLMNRWSRSAQYTVELKEDEVVHLTSHWAFRTPWLKLTLDPNESMSSLSNEVIEIKRQVSELREKLG